MINDPSPLKEYVDRVRKYADDRGIRETIARSKGEPLDDVWRVALWVADHYMGRDDAEPVDSQWLVDTGWDAGIHWPNIQTASNQLLEWRGAGCWIENTPIAACPTRGHIRRLLSALGN
jgi:hypothetical protein